MYGVNYTNRIGLRDLRDLREICSEEDGCKGWEN
jgi:hypothetical protein